MEKEKSERKDRLFYKQKNGYDLIDEKELELVEAYCKDYMVFLNDAKTEREAVSQGIKLAEAKGFVPGLKSVSRNVKALGAGIVEQGRGIGRVVALLAEAHFLRPDRAEVQVHRRGARAAVERECDRPILAVHRVGGEHDLGNLLAFVVTHRQ